jgi:Na+-transporting methylmalonyl-CoA/oxaloacetate decarboxylase gamma subunit
MTQRDFRNSAWPVTLMVTGLALVLVYLTIGLDLAVQVVATAH